MSCFSSLSVKVEEDNGYHHPIKHEKPLKRERDEDEYVQYGSVPIILMDNEKKVKKRKQEDSDYEEREKPKKRTKEVKKDSTGGKKKAKNEPQEKWKWWEEEKYTDGSKWRFLEHKGPVFPPPYEPLPDRIRFYYDVNLPVKSAVPVCVCVCVCDFLQMSLYPTLLTIFLYFYSTVLAARLPASYCIMFYSNYTVIQFTVHKRFGSPPGTRWKEVRHDNKVTWLVSWTENIQGSIKYIMLNPSSRIKGEKDWQKYETARRLKKSVARIRAQYREDWRSKEMRIRQRAVALYFIDKLALRAGNEKDEGETADTVGCCSLRVEHIRLHPQMDGQDYVVELDFPGKDSIRYYNKVPVQKRVFKNLQLFLENKQGKDDLFDRLNTSVLNKHLQELMDGLTVEPDDNIPEKILSYNRANRAVAVLCIHQRAPPKTFEKSINLNSGLLAVINKHKPCVSTKKKAVQRISEQLMKLEVQATDREENKQIALGTSKLNYLDLRISVAWCKKWGVPIEKIYNKTQREKFAWAIDMTDEDFEF
uniref:DNA topoisomerase I n=1 Tax=Cyprinus carpio TaxID=7962 RepID=A0A8C1QWK7_CYPCA